jgi:hypothetical protein
MAAAPTKTRIRSYNVGFGDCFLLTFFYGDRDARHVLIDFGSTKAPRSGPKDLVDVAKQIREDSGGKLDIVVATHRHADHISGFGSDSGEVIASLKPELVVQPWTEDPKLQPDAKGPTAAAPPPGGGAPALVSRLSNMQTVAAAAHAEAARLEESPSVRKTVREQLSFLGETNLANDAAVRNLMTMGKQPAVYASFGSKLRTADLLPGVRIEVLGPPTLEQSAEIAVQRATDPDEFWHLAATSAAGTIQADGDPPPLFGGAAVEHADIPQEARWVIPEIDRMRSEEMLALVRILDSVLNNTSLILLFEVAGTRLLFPGDAQIENWSYALFGARNHKAIRERLAGAHFYKVGHHGSLNATPKTLWHGFEHRSQDAQMAGRLATMVSTLSGKHGSVDRGTEVPRKVLLTELKEMSDLHDTQTLRSARKFWNDVEFRH